MDCFVAFAPRNDELWRSGRLAAALRGLELDPAIERVAGIVLAGADDHLARALAGGDQPAEGPSLPGLETILDVVGAQTRQAVVDCRQAGGAGVADHFQTALLGRSA